MLFLAFAALASGNPAPPLSPALETLSADGHSLVGPGYRRRSPVVSAALTEHLLEKDWSAAIAQLEAIDDRDLTTRTAHERAFLLAWVLIRSGEAERAARLLPQLDHELQVPAPYLHTVRGELLLAAGEPLRALEELEQVPPRSAIYPRAAVLRAETLQELGRRREASEVFEAIASRPDPAPGNALALLALAQHHGPGSPASYPYLRRLWTYYPATDEGRRATEILGRMTGERYAPTAEAWSIRAERWMTAGAWNAAIKAADQALSTPGGTALTQCRARFVKGRSYYKKNHLSKSIAAFGNAGEDCATVDEPYGAKALYLQGRARFRKRDYRGSADTFRKIPTLYPHHSMADDGYTHAGIALQEAGDLGTAQEMWRAALSSFPEGDTVPEATWRLAWSHYLAGEGAEARAVAQRLAALPLEVDAVHVDAGRYWAARWALFPDVEAPSRAREEGRAEALAGWEALVRDRPMSFYAILAAARLAEEAPARLEALQRRGEREPLTRPWRVRTSFLEHEGIRHGTALARLGLVREALLEWERFEGELEPDEAAWLHELRAEGGDWLSAHASLRRWLKKHPLGTLGPGERAIVRIAYPDRYWEEVRAAATYPTYEPRLFHALVREESNFNRQIVSFAGARGLSQLMPATATQTARSMGRNVALAALFDPQTNLDIGARYLHQVHASLAGSPYLALAGYNAGPGRVRQWWGEWGDVPTDEYVERIPFRETRGYVKRVMGTWQVYRWYIDDGPPFPDLSRFNHRAMP